MRSPSFSLSLSWQRWRSIVHLYIGTSVFVQKPFRWMQNMSTLGRRGMRIVYEYTLQNIQGTPPAYIYIYAYTSQNFHALPLPHPSPLTFLHYAKHRSLLSSPPSHFFRIDGAALRRRYLQAGGGEPARAVPRLSGRVVLGDARGHGIVGL